MKMSLYWTKYSSLTVLSKVVKIATSSPASYKDFADYDDISVSVEENSACQIYKSILFKITNEK